MLTLRQELRVHQRYVLLACTVVCRAFGISSACISEDPPPLFGMAQWLEPLQDFASGLTTVQAFP